ncbi:MAG: amino acid adenylation domain-containing protein [Myxococcota bacterium]
MPGSSNTVAARLPFHRVVSTADTSDESADRIVDTTLSTRIAEFSATVGVEPVHIYAAAHLLTLGVLTQERSLDTVVISNDRARALSHQSSTRSKREVVEDVARQLAQTNPVALDDLAEFETALIYGSESRSSLAPGLLFGFSAAETARGTRLGVSTRSLRISPELARYALNIYTEVLGAIVCTPDEPLTYRDYLAQDEFESIVLDFNDTITPYDESALLHTGFDRQAQTCPSRVALVWGETSVSYGELQRNANQLANLWLSSGLLEPGDRVALLSERSPFAIAAMLAALKAGCTYIPIDPEFPPERQRYIIENSEARFIAADRSYDIVDELGVPAFVSGDERLANQPTTGPTAAASPEDLAYVIYTSGSTGRPKGVMVEHRSAVNLVETINREYTVDASDRLILLSSLCFDLSVYDVFGALSVGASLLLITPDQIVDGFKLAEQLERHHVTLWNSVPSTMSLLLEVLSSPSARYTLPDLRLVLLSGDWIPLRLPSVLADKCPSARLISLGGATEGTVWSNHYPVGQVASHWASIPYGYPLANNFFYVLDDDGQPLPREVVGELCIGGLGVARGYMNDEERTARAFVDNPFTQAHEGRLYRTGDLGRLTLEGHLEIIGRKDAQVKINGYRIELGEVEHALERNDQVERAVAVARSVNQAGDRQLVAYVVGRSGIDLDPGELRDHLAGIVPSYMVPSLFVFVDELPQNDNGKIDRSKLPAPDLASIKIGPKAAPPSRGGASPVHRHLHAFCSEELGLELSTTTATLVDLGLTSLGAVRLLTEVHREFGIELSVALLMSLATLDGLVSYVEEHASASGEGSSAVVAAEALDAPETPIPLTGLQRSYWFGEGSFFPLGQSIAHTYREHQISSDAAARLDDAINALIAAHPVLRAFVTRDGHWKILPEAKYRCTRTEFTADSDVDKELEALRTEHREHGVETSSWPLFEFHAVKLPDESFRLLSRIDLILLDGVSIDNLFRQLSDLLATEVCDVAPPRSTYEEYRRTWMSAFVNTDRFREAERYWKAAVPSLPDAPRLPQLRPIDDAPRSSLTTKSFTVDADPWSRLQREAEAIQVSPSLLLYAAFALVLRRWNEAPRFTVNVLYYNREPLVEEVGQVFGNFSSTVLSAVDVRRGESFVAFLRRLSEQRNRELKHAIYDGVDVLTELNRRRSDDHRGMPVVFTSLLGVENSGKRDVLSEAAFGVQTPQVYLDMLVRESGEKLVVTWSVQEDLFEPGLFDDMQWSLQHVLGRIAREGIPDERLDVALPPQQAKLVSESSASGSLRGRHGIHVLNDEGQFCPVGVVGHAFTKVLPGGKDNTFTVPCPGSGALLHGAGQRCRYLGDGSVEFLDEPDVAVDLQTSESDDTSVPQRERAIAQMAVELEQAWGELLGLSNIGVDANFFELGGSSLSAVRLLSKIEQRFGHKLPVAELYRRSTPQALAAYLVDRPQNAPALTAADDNFLLLQPDGDRSPFFCIHAISGHALGYRALAQQLRGSDRPFYGIQAFGIESGQQPISSIPEIAKRYVAALRKIDPQGPYSLGGWSFGGLVAYEAGRQLIAAGQRVDQVIMLDTVVPSLEPHSDLHDAPELYQLFLADVEASQSIHPDTSGDKGRASIQTLAAQPLEKLFRVYSAHSRAMADYTVEPIDAPVTLLRATERRPSEFDAHLQITDDALGWSVFPNVRVVDVPGDHFSIFAEQNLPRLVDVLTSALEPASGDAYMLNLSARANASVDDGAPAATEPAKRASGHE